MRNTPRDASGKPLYALVKPQTPRLTFFSHDWTDKTTWYTNSEHVDGETAATVSPTVFQLGHTNIIDLAHGRVFGEDYIQGCGFSITGYTEKDPHTLSGDFVVNYETGTITFDEAPALPPVCYYSYATDSTFIVAPPDGKVATIEVVEVQFSADVTITDTARFQVWVFAPPELCTANGWPIGTKVPYGPATVYKRITDFQADAVRAYPGYPAMGGNGWRGLTQAIYVFDWDYLASIPLRSDQGAEIRVSLDHDVPFGGTYASATFYCTTEDI